MLTDGTKDIEWTATDKQRLINTILTKTRDQSFFNEKSESVIETLRRVLEEEL
jgi:hypothetical protein